MKKEDERMGGRSKEKENTLSPKEASLLFTPVAMWSLLGLLLVAIWFKFLPLIIVSTFLLLLGGVILLWKEQALKKVQPTLEVPRTRIFNGEAFHVQATVKNDKWLPLVWLEWYFDGNQLISWEKSKSKEYTMRFLWMRAYDAVSWEIQGMARRRGVYPIGELYLRSGDGFRFTEKVRRFNLQKELYIYPKLLNVQVPLFSPSMQWDADGKQGGFLEDPLLIQGIREYEPGDEWRRFNWRASARTGKMLTNVYQPVVSEQVMIHVDVEGFLIDPWKYEDELEERQKYRQTKQVSFERFLSVSASVAVNYHNQDMHVGFSSNGFDGRGNQLPYVSPSVNLNIVLDQFAKMTQLMKNPMTIQLNPVPNEFNGAVALFIFCEKVTKAHYMWYERQRQKRKIHFYFLEASEYSNKLTHNATPISRLVTQGMVSHS